MKDLSKRLRVAVAQSAPVLFNKEETLKKAAEIIKKAGRQGAQLVVFPEAYIPAYPRGFSYGFVVGSRTMEGREDWKRYYDGSVIVPSQDTDMLAAAAGEAGVYLSIGVTERDEKNCTLYCTNLFFSPEGKYIGKHRKLKPTGTERCIWGEGQKDTAFTTVDTPWGVMGSLICWENYMPLARAALYEKGVSLYIAPTADSREEWQSTMRHIALEGRCFVIGCNQYVHRDMYPQDFNYQSELERQPEHMCPGGSCIVDPFGKYVAGPVWNREELLLADLDMEKVVLSRIDFDPSGHYSRPDIVSLRLGEKE